MNQRKPNRKKQRGFTLMELLVVLAILVLLIAIVTPRIIGTQEKADEKATQIQIGSFKGALERYALEMKGFPKSEQGLKALVSRPSDDEGKAGQKWDGPYLNDDVLPSDPWGNKYQYEYPPVNGKGKFPDIWSYGPDGEDGTDDDIVSWKKSSEDGEESGFGNDEDDFSSDLDMDDDMGFGDE